MGYHRGFGNTFESEAIPGALPLGRNNPRLVPFDLYAEQLSGTAFTAPRAENRRTWLYRTRPGACGTSSPFRPCGGGRGGGAHEDANNGGGSMTTSASSSLPRTFGRADWSNDMRLDPNPMRWGATPLEQTSGEEEGEEEKENGNGNGNGNKNNDAKKINFLQGIRTLLGSGDPTCKSGICIYVYAFNADMMSPSSSGGGGRGGGGGSSSASSASASASSSSTTTATTQDVHFYNSDGDFLIVPQRRTLRIQTEMGKMDAAPGEICVIPRGIVFAVNIVSNANVAGGGGGSDDREEEDGDDDTSFARGYVLEIFRGHFVLPELGPLGSNGLANARDFLHPVAWYESDESVACRPCIVANKFGQSLFVRSSPHSPYNVVAWHGNYLPYKYDLRNFCALNSVTYDHPDPSIYTVLTAKGGDEDGTALADFVIFPPRIMATGELGSFEEEVGWVCHVDTGTALHVYVHPGSVLMFC